MKQVFIFLLLFKTLFLHAQSAYDSIVPPNTWPYWGSFERTALEDISPQLWDTTNHTIAGWDWSLPPETEASDIGYLVVRRYSAYTGSGTVPYIANPIDANVVVAFWIRWKELEPQEGAYNFEDLINAINQFYENQGVKSIIRIMPYRKSDAPNWTAAYAMETQMDGNTENFNPADSLFRSFYLKIIDKMGELDIAANPGVAGIYVGNASASNGDEGIGNDTLPETIEKLDAFAAACAGNERKVFMGGPSEYGFSLGFGMRNGFIENYLYQIPRDYNGQDITDEDYLYVDESVPLIANNLFWGEENEEYNQGQFWGPHGYEPFNYRYFSAALRTAQSRINYLLSNSDINPIPDMTAWEAMQLGKTVEDAPDVWCFLRENTLRPYVFGQTRQLKNFERWLHQRDAPGYETVPAVRISSPGTNSWIIPADKDYDYIARQGQNIGFNIDDRFLSQEELHTVALKVSYFDFQAGEMKIQYKTTAGEQEIAQSLVGDEALKTRTFILEDAIFDADFDEQNIEYDFVISGKPEAVVSFVRLVPISSTVVNSLDEVQPNQSSVNKTYKVYYDKEHDQLSLNQLAIEPDQQVMITAITGRLIARLDASYDVVNDVKKILRNEASGIYVITLY